MKRIFVFLSVFFVVILTGCVAPHVVSSVTVFQNLSENDANRSYQIIPTATQVNNLEFSSYAGLLNAQLLRYGFVSTDKNPALKVTFSYSTKQKIQSTLEPVSTYAPYGIYRMQMYSPTWEHVVETAYMHQLEVDFRRMSDGKTIYTVRARLVSSSPEISESMGYLMESAFNRFPGQNGVTQDVILPLRQ